jgi:hypothetical protein
MPTSDTTVIGCLGSCPGCQKIDTTVATVVFQKRQYGLRMRLQRGGTRIKVDTF